MDLIRYVKIVRPINLLIILVTQGLFYFLILEEAFIANSIPHISISSILLISISTMFMGAASYVINDIYDRSIDEVNKPDKSYLAFDSAVRNAKVFYAILVGFAFALSFYVAIESGKYHLIWIAAISILLVHLYSSYYKGQGIIGNIIVAGFCAFTIGILLVVEWDAIIDLKNLDWNRYTQIMTKSIGYMLFAFWLTFIREIVKDLEDMEGDKLIASNSLPLIFGEHKTRVIVEFLMMLTIIAVALWVFISKANIWLGLVLLLLPSVYIAYISFRVRSKKDYHFLSSLLKWYMVLGLIYIFM